MRETYEKYRAGSNPVEYFREKVLTVTDESGACVRKDRMFHEYLEFCRAKKIAPESEWSFDRKLKAMKFNVKRFRKGSDRFYGWAGVKIEGWKETEEKEQQTFEDLPNE